MVLVAFWGMARLAELTYDKAVGNLYSQVSVLTTDVAFELDGSKTITYVGIRGAKTSHPENLPIMLCPIEALKRRIAEADGAETSLFGIFDHEGERHHITKPEACRTLTAIWRKHGHLDLSGHSFRVGGASFRSAMDTPVEVIQYLGRWNSDCYKLYLRDYSTKDKLAAISLWSELKACWAKA
ncbi:hypothetical protein MJO28_016808 [Puccinia striiformis f. sp. tritici]|nr:hypothetical protein MJO28_016808 [Puccinia striiformis f. sp. tritici]